jgi:hypothetical protein
MFLDMGTSGVQYGGLVARVTGSSFYWGMILNNNGVFSAAVYRYQGGAFNLLASAPVSTGSTFDCFGRPLAAAVLQ